MTIRTFRVKSRLPYSIYLVAALLPNNFVFGVDYAEQDDDEPGDLETQTPPDARLNRLTPGIAAAVIDDSLPCYGVEELDRLEDEAELWSSYLSPLDDGDGDAPKPDKVYRMQPNGWFTVLLKDSDLPGWRGGADLDDFAGGSFDASMDAALDTVFEPGRPPTLLIVASSRESLN